MSTSDQPLKLLLVWALCLICSGKLPAQFEQARVSNAAILKEKSVTLKATDTTGANMATTPFYPNINQKTYFQDKRLIRMIQKAEAQEDSALLDRLLDQYIPQFGIENFRKDYRLLWMAAQVKEYMGDPQMAMYYYELVFKHCPPDVMVSRVSYDSIRGPMTSKWIPLKKYYDLLEFRKQIDTLKPPKVLTPMGMQVNSGHPEYAPFTHVSDSILIFTSRRKVRDLADPFARKNEDLFISFKIWEYDTAFWDTAMIMSDAINSEFNEGSSCLSPDGQTLFFTRCGKMPDGFGDCDVYYAKQKSPGKWTKARNLGPMINSDYWDSQPNLSADGQTLFFTSSRPGGFGGTDLYYSTKDEKGNWLEAQNLGPIINTSMNEVTPFFHEINNTLYFSSMGQLTNYGGFDIYKSRRMLNTWEEPKNVGPLVNTEGNEYYFSIDGQGKTIFYARADREGQDHLDQNFDLYSFPMPMDASPKATTQLRGYLLDSKTQQPLVGTVMVIDMTTGKEITPKKINPDGYFEFTLEPQKKYRIIAVGKNFLTLKKEVILDSDTTFQVLTELLQEGEPIVFESLKYGSNSYKFNKEVIPQLDYLAEFMQRYPMFELVVEGHTDADGDEKKNMILSLKRAEEIGHYLKEKGELKSSRITAKGFGESRPLVPNDSQVNKKKNRRVEFKLYRDPNYKGDVGLPSKDELRFRNKNTHDMKESLPDGEKK